MVKRINISQLQNKLRQLELQQRQALNRYNQQVRQHNQQVRQRIQRINSEINRYNSAVRTYNARVRADQQRLKQEISRLGSHGSSRYVTYRESVVRLNSSYEELDYSSRTRKFTPAENYLTDLSERETANSVSLLNALDDEQIGVEDEAQGDLQVTVISDEIRIISVDFDNRWRGALFSLSPRNPEAARHFCTSVREIFVGILETSAPDEVVEQEMPDCQRTPNGSVTRRSKLDYLLQRKGIDNPELASFASDNVGNVIDLFSVLNGGTHGESGRHDLDALRMIKKRVEDCLLFICQIAA